MPRRIGLSWIITAALLTSAAASAQEVHVRVSPDLKGTALSRDGFPTIQMALDPVPHPGEDGRLHLHIAPGVYREQVIVTQNRTRTAMLGTAAKPEALVITASQSGLVRSTSG